MEFAILIVTMLLITGVLMCYVNYLNSVNNHHLKHQLNLVDDQIENCDNSYRLKKLIALRRKLKSKIDKI